MMKLITQILTLLFFIVFQSEAISLTKPDSKPGTVMFKVTKSGQNRSSYLFGTHHALDKAFFDSLAPALEALNSSSVLIKENLNIPGQLAEDLINQRTTETKWGRYLDKEEFDFVQDLLSSTALNLHKVTPAELYALLSRKYKESICVRKAPDADYFSLDDYIGSLAAKNQMEVKGLETTEDQLYLINEDLRGMPRKVHKRRLANMIARFSASSDELCEEIAWYRQMDMDYEFDKACSNALILTDRNKKWMTQIVENLQTENCFIAVGLSHLMYDCGLINQLRLLGYTVEPVLLK
ncbi:TraB/GumN family protein [Algoriphagus halophytocola]|uniref:TraB/GumN family protein n=1 Tax=Algoriphagus halophytocola TaxID=2991499 RepID=A0ABY6ME27_9BACT|nr:MULTISPECIES: TraB/GumN family protein [unclassified Algoriphagus]UZD21403.1 TraB/GumN family protein [Algoriphagus sp. TR-M5]WBL42616.1 TraB/GumN family protein [Algoriphagus sp. TR-M9]